MINCCKQRRFFVTKSGSIDIGPMALEEGDVIVVLEGGHLSFILRRAEHRGSDFYNMIGPAYVHEIMDGEAVHNHLAQGKEFEVFHLI